MSTRALWLIPAALVVMIIVLAGLYTSRRPMNTPGSDEHVTIDVVPVPLNPADPTATALGDFRYAGGLALRSRQTDLLHELSDIIVSADGSFVAVGDEGTELTARIVLDATGRLAGITDASVTRLSGQDGRPLTGDNADAEGLTLLPTGDRLVSFETGPRIWLYPRDGGPPRAVPSPPAPAPANASFEALAADPAAGADSYIVGSEDSGRTWACRVSSPCVAGPAVDKPGEFGLVSMNRLPDGMTAVLLRAYDPVRRNRVTLTILRGTSELARLYLAPPLTVDNFEGVAWTPGPHGGYRFYLISDDNSRATQRTLLLAFDWRN